jgi:hypothetical protein
MRRALVVVVFASVVHCGGGGGDDSIAYTEDGDRAFATAIVGVWQTHDGTTTVTVCEDTAADAQRCNRISPAIGHAMCESTTLCHVVHGGGEARDESFNRSSGGCGCEQSGYGSMPLRLSVDDAKGPRTLRAAANVDPTANDAYAGPVYLQSLDGITGFVDRHARSMSVTIGAESLDLVRTADVASCR